MHFDILIKIMLNLHACSDSPNLSAVESLKIANSRSSKGQISDHELDPYLLRLFAIFKDVKIQMKLTLKKIQKL